MEFSCLVGAKPDPNQQLDLVVSDDGSSETASMARRSLPMTNSNVAALAVLGRLLDLLVVLPSEDCRGPG